MSMYCCACGMCVELERILHSVALLSCPRNVRGRFLAVRACLWGL